jgi:microcystin-dependent protein
MKILSIVVVCLGLKLAAVLQAQSIPSLMNYQGRLTDEAGQPLPNGTYRLAFRLFAEPIEGTPLWQEEQKISLVQGNFNAVLGSANPAITNAFNGANRYLELTVLKDPDGAPINRALLPRQQLLSAPYAMIAGNLIKDLADALCPPGTIVAFGGPAEEVPDGWIMCDGRDLPIADFERLHKKIRFLWGNPGSGRFRVPDLRGLFLRGGDAGSGRDPDRDRRTSIHPGGAAGNEIGSYQPGEFKEHRHNITYTHNNVPVTANLLGAHNSAGGVGFNHGSYFTPVQIVALDVKQSGGAETRPANVYINYIIKY